MNKYLIVLLLAIGLTACATKDAHYYRLNLKELQKVLSACPQQVPPKVSCQALEQIAEQMNQLGLQLQSNPQGFGFKISNLQSEIAKQESDLKKNPEDNALKQSMAHNKQELADYLAVVKWLESPEG